MTSAFTVKRGDTFDIPLQRLDADGNAVDITGMVVKAQLKYGATVHELVETVTDAPNGKVTIGAPASDTINWELRRHKCDVQYTTSGGVVSSSDTFHVDVIEDVTDAP